MSDESTKSAEQNWPSLYRWCMVVSATFTKVENVTWGCNLSATFSTEVHHIWLSHDQLRAALLIGQNAVKFDIHHYRMMNVSTVDRVTLQCCTVTWLCNIAMSHGHMTMHHVVYYNITYNQNVTDSSHVNKYLRKIKINLRTKVGISISTYSNADVVCYSTLVWHCQPPVHHNTR